MIQMMHTDERFIGILENKREEVVRTTKAQFMYSNTRTKFICPRKIKKQFNQVIKRFDEFDRYEFDQL